MVWIKRSALICLLTLTVPAFAAAQGGRNSIEGRILGLNGRGIQDVRVTLKNTNYTDVGQDITDSTGSYRFLNLPDGVYYIDILPLGTLYEGQSRRVQLQSFSTRRGGASETYHFDFQLRPLRPIEKPLPKKLAESLLFVQEVPADARQRYKDAQRLLEKQEKEKSYELLRQAIEIFPDYYDALDLLGTEYLAAGWFDVAVPLFLQAVDVNRKGWHSYYGLGAAYASLNMKKKSVEALRKSIELNPVNAKTHLRLGIELAKDKESFEESITVFRRAIELDAIGALDAYPALAAIYSKLGRYNEAAEALEAYLKVAPDPENLKAIREKIRELKKKVAN